MSGPVDNVQELLKTVGMTRREAVDNYSTRNKTEHNGVTTENGSGW